MSGTHSATHLRSCPKCSRGLFQSGGCKPGHGEPACPPAASACKEDRCHQAEPRQGRETSQKMPFQQPLHGYMDRASPQQMFRTQHSAVHGGTSKTNHLEKKTANYFLAPPHPPAGIPGLKVTGKGSGGQRVSAKGGSGRSASVKQCSQQGCSCSGKIRRGSAARSARPGQLLGHPQGWPHPTGFSEDGK